VLVPDHANPLFTRQKFGMGVAPIPVEELASMAKRPMDKASHGGVAMKQILFVFVLLSANAAFGQYIVNHIDNQPQPFQAPDHPAHASYSQMAVERPIVGGGGFSFGQGDRPASDFPQMAAVPLGDTARELRKQHTKVKKAHIVWEN
jgi:hypothetical protein